MMNSTFAIRWIAVVCAVAWLGGCGGKKKETKEQPERDKAARMLVRAEEVRKRIDDLQHSLVQLYQETEIQQAKIRAAQENLNALRKTLGELAKATRTPDQLTSLGVGGAPVEVPRLRPAEDQAQKVDRKKQENRALETLLILAFAAFLVGVVFKLTRKKNELNSQAAPAEAETDSYTIVKPPTPPSHSTESPDAPAGSASESPDHPSSPDRSPGA